MVALLFVVTSGTVGVVRGSLTCSSCTSFTGTMYSGFRNVEESSSYFLSFLVRNLGAFSQTSHGRSIVLVLLLVKISRFAAINGIGRKCFLNA